MSIIYEGLFLISLNIELIYKAITPSVNDVVAPKNKIAVINAVHPGIFIPRKNFTSITEPIVTEVKKAIRPTKKLILIKYPKKVLMKFQKIV